MTQQTMQPLMRETASQTAGPYVHIGLAPLQTGLSVFANNFDDQLANAQTQGQRIRIEGRVFDGIGTVLKDVLIESWQANAAGKYAHPADLQPGKSIDPNFRGWGRSCTDFDTGLYSISTIKPGLVAGRNGRFMAPHINLWIVARGINLGLNTRLYFSDEVDANGKDAVLNLIEWEARRQTLVAQRVDVDADVDRDAELERNVKSNAEGAVVYRFDIRLQGENETVFFDI